MGFEIKSPRPNGQLPRAFLAWGTKVGPDDLPLGMMVSVTAGTPDGRYAVGGTTLAWKPGAVDHTMWAIHFAMPHVAREDRFRLVVLNARDLRAEVPASRIVERLSIKKRDLRPKAALSAKAVQQAELIQSPNTQSRSQITAYGYLPGNDYDLETGTRLVIPGYNDVPPDWSWVDGGGFWAAFFPPITSDPNVTAVTLNVVYKPSSSEEDQGIALED